MARRKKEKSLGQVFAAALSPAGSDESWLALTHPLDQEQTTFHHVLSEIQKDNKSISFRVQAMEDYLLVDMTQKGPRPGQTSFRATFCRNGDDRFTVINQGESIHVFRMTEPYDRNDLAVLLGGMMRGAVLIQNGDQPAVRRS